jgi:hypothetical protein
MNSAFGQGHFDLGSNVVGVGIGLGSSYGTGYGGSSDLGFNFQYERGMWDVGGPGIISLGAYVAFKSYSYDYFGYSWTSNATVIGARSAYHFNGIKSDKFDVYAGLMLALRTFSYSDNIYYAENSSDVVFSGFIGGRYYFNENFGAFAELGNGISIMNIGIVYKF